jgi:acetyl-CoA/propionyl-CoA carboxylase, PccX subunit
MSDSDLSIRVLADVGGEETAAITAAIDSYLRAERAALAASRDAEADEGWNEPGRRWAFAGRMGSLDRSRTRAPDDAPTDPWAAAGRTDRF